MISQTQICINGIKDAVCKQEEVTDKVIDELLKNGAVSASTAIELQMSRQALRDCHILFSQLEEEVSE